MTARRFIPGLLLALLGLAALAGPAHGQTHDAVHMMQVIRLLDEVVETKDFTNPMTLKDALMVFYEKYAARGKDLPMVVDVAAFRASNPDSDSPYNAQVQLPPVPKQMPMLTALRIFLGQLPVEATFVIRQDRVEIIPRARAEIKALLQERVLTQYAQLSLQEVLDDLSAKTGAAIVLDVRAKDKAKERISIVLNNLSLEDALTVLTEEAGLRFVTLRTGIFVTLPADAESLEKRESRRSAAGS